MYKITIKKSKDTFNVSCKLTEEYKNLVKNIKGRKWITSSNEWELPINDFKIYFSNLEKIADRKSILVINDESENEDDYISNIDEKEIIEKYKKNRKSNILLK